ncbi:MAG: GAF domain-containing sensor histidine kinase [Candidatus Omnitrophica bacterium]|nr:GAF domain-containing sensor histidine kinase [Candidatus Omnitrophota bacterium]
MYKEIPKSRDVFSARTEEIRELMNNACFGQRDVQYKRFSDFTSAHNIGKEVALRFELAECLKLLIDRIAETMSVEIISLMLVERNGTRLAIEVARGLSEEAVKNTKVNVGEGVAGWIAKTGESLLVEDITKDERFPSRGGKYYTNSLLSVPLKISNRVIGVINVNNKTSKSVFIKDDLEMLSTVAEMAAVAIENARFRQDARTQEQMRSNFISNVSHELRTPLTAIKEAVCMILEEIIGTVSGEQKRFLEIAKKNIERLNRLIEGLLDLGKLESKKCCEKRRLFDVIEVTNAVIELLGPLAKEKAISLTKVLPQQKVEIWGDADRVTQVITNLLGNSIKYNRQNGTIEVRVSETDEAVTISIVDTGVGISPEDAEKIFERFYRVKTHSGEQKHGTGLGLAITKEIVHAHGGKILVESQIDKGSMFTVILPKDLRKKKE